MHICVVGATGEVGRMMLKTLEEEQINFSKLTLLASRKSAGKQITVSNKNFFVKELSEEEISKKYDYILMSAGSSISKKYSPIAARNGNIIIDNSSAFRRDENIPLIVPEINGNTIQNYQGIIANPNCSTIQMVLALHKIHTLFKIKKIIVSTYQAVSGAGKKGIDSLLSEENHTNGESIFQKRIHHNVIPLIGTILENNYSEEEEKMRFETNKIFQSNIKISATTVRVPVIYGHSESVYFELEKEAGFSEIENILQNSPSVKYHKNDIFTPEDLENSTLSHVCRLRKSFDNNSYTFWNVANNIRVGAATNAVRIIIKHFNLQCINNI